MNLKAFPFFDSLEAMRQACQHGEALVSPLTRLLPFQIAKPRDGQPIDCVNVYREDGTLYRTIMASSFPYAYHQSASTDFITYYGATLAQPLACGTYYLNIGTHYSAIFNAVSSVSDLLKVEWLNTSNLTDSAGKPLVMYQTGFLQRVYLGSEVTSPTYPYQETGNENEYKEFLADFKRVSKQSQFETLKLPEYLVDALGSLPIHSTVHIGPFQEVKEVEVTPTWRDFGTGASVKVTFSESTPVIAMGCGDMEIEEYDLSGYTPRGYLCGVPDSNPYWQNTGVTSCEQDGGENTGYLMVEQRDINESSATYNQLRAVRGQQDVIACPVPVTYYSIEQSEYVQRNNCPSGQTGGEYLVRVLAGAFSSTLSQTDANNKALAHLNTIKQAEANSYGACVVQNVYQYAGRVGANYATQSQACAYAEAFSVVYTESGMIELGEVLYKSARADSATLTPGYYQLEAGGVIRVGPGGYMTMGADCEFRQ